MRGQQTAPPLLYCTLHFHPIHRDRHKYSLAQINGHTHTCIYKQYKKQKLIRTNKACLNVWLHVSVHSHAGAINLFRLVACFNYYNQPPIIGSSSVAVAVKNKLKQFHL